MYFWAIGNSGTVEMAFNLNYCKTTIYDVLPLFEIHDSTEDCCEFLKISFIFPAYKMNNLKLIN